MSTPRNTTRDMQDPANSLAFLLQASTDGGPGDAIERMEAQGQREIVASQMLPTELGYGETVADYEALGFSFGEVDPADPLFRSATLPEGWTRRASDHSMGSYLADERGVDRVNVFYKAAFYDRKADMHLINVGEHLATQWIYGNATTIELPDALTEEERSAVATGAQGYLNRAEESPGIYKDRLPRAQSLLERIAEAQS